MSFFDLLIVTRAGSPLTSVQDIVKAASANPGTLNIGTINPGSTQNLAAELFRSVTGIAVTIVPFRTSPDMATALLRGDVDVAFEFYAGDAGPDRRQEGRRACLHRTASAPPICPTCRPSQESGHQRFRSGELERHLGPCRHAQGR